ncbi:hypothetical protein [Nonomuraea sp. SYSU D8015]|uniref:hypothetical protein n=1 Tax=Nonomuraea sp. SYSU D8015 TaxID=2593644 RepID=UPI0016617419|nr:hypothetical protein [Nonomuraea sp. SYSU D8015]
MSELDWSDEFGGLEEFIKVLGHEVLLRVEDGFYRGNTRLLLRDTKGRYGVVNLEGCSGCYLAAVCRTQEQADRLLTGIRRDIVWKHNARAMRDYLQTLQWTSGEPTKTEEFRAEAIDLLTQIMENPQ